MPRSVVTNFKNKMGWLYSIEFAISLRVDWVKLGELGFTERMATYLMKISTEDEFSFTCNGWKNVFAISKPIFQELCVEFFASVSFEDATMDPYFAQALVFFCLMGEYQECKLAQFSWRMGIYDQNEKRYPIFDIFLRSAAREYFTVGEWL